ncbi:toll-like receptor 7 [Patella vulgata]|uniref:toll-like receptor 7 n=1 Tax=Patella vulgata TaxID=6465 RepID=UPI00217F9ADB|nr:toll-like receptor 7 [Patella vulgata]
MKDVIQDIFTHCEKFYIRFKAVQPKHPCKICCLIHGSDKDFLTWILMETLKWTFLLLVVYPVETITLNYGKERDINLKETSENGLGDFIVSQKKQNWTRCGDNMCQCKGYQARCVNHGHQLNYIPRFEKNITKLNFTSNYLPFIDNETFTNVTEFQLIFLVLRNTSIKNCTRNAFNGLKSLRSLFIRNNTISSMELMDCLSGITKDLNHLDLEFIYLDKPWDLDLDKIMTHSKISNLHLRSIEIPHYNQSKLSTLKHLEIIQIYKSSMNTVTFDYSSTLKKLEFAHNQFFEFPKFCVNDYAYFPHLTYLNLGHNNIQSIKPELLTCLKFLKQFEIDNNRIHLIESNTFLNLPKLLLVSISYNGPDMVLQEFAFNSSSLKELYLNDNDMYFVDGQKHVSKDAFKYCTQLEVLRVSSNHFEFTTSQMFEETFSTLVNLRILSLAHGGVQFLPSFIPKYLGKLKTLWLSHNNIIYIPEGYFISLHSLQNVQLNSNKITTVKPNTFSLQFLKKVKSIDLSNNTFSCTCELLWFINFLKTSPIRKRFIHFPKEYICGSPTVYSGKQLLQVRLSERTCAITYQTRLIIISVSAGILLLVLTISVVYRYRWYLRYILYMARFQHVRYQRLLNGGENYNHDVYLSSCDADFDDVIYDYLVPRLEVDMGLRLYIPQRDGQGNKIDQIISNMDASRKIILFISDKYVEDGYCEFEASYAYNKYINEKRDLMIVVVFKELGALNVTKTIHKILAVDNYIKWGWDEESVELFWLKITTAINNMDDLIP